ncbi:hypothetical protein [Bradyrhizobium sp.]|uniref:hypothetical protein n=1 Tax=Bradyrhizobium sp. TaxID=376 RepID=UPI003BB0E54A
MADEAFALSPISARAAQPSEADYAAIREAFMETSRGRWFLGEYAKRNRNADTSMVLDAVARIEDALAAQRQQQPAPDTRFEAALAAFRSAVDQADAAVSTTLDGLALEQNLAPILKGARIVREISWRWREIGADGRICDLLDSQVGAIEAGCEQISSSDPRPALRAAFELIRAQIEAFGEADAPATEAVAPAAPPPREKPVAVDEVEADAHDEALLDLVAMEMAAPDGADDFDVTEPEFEQAPVAAASLAEPEKAPPAAETAVMVQQPQAIQPPPRPAAEPLREPPPEPRPPREAAAEPSLGSTIIESGILRRPSIPANDPLAPIRRMSQTEKIALFS